MGGNSDNASEQLVQCSVTSSQLGPPGSPQGSDSQGCHSQLVQTGVWDLPVVLGEALLMDGMSVLLLIVFMAASREHVQSSDFSGSLFPCLFPTVLLQTQSVVGALTKSLEHLLPASSSMNCS